MFDFCTIFDLKTKWNIDKKCISFYKARSTLTQKEKIKAGKPALIRLEDIGPGGVYGGAESLEKLRIISDYLYTENVPFHVAYVSRYIDPRPQINIDNDPSNSYSIYNADFLYTIDYLIYRNGVIGLHGYTHQYKNTITMSGIEFHRSLDDNVPGSFEYAANRIGLAITSARKLDIPFSFFEAPHYAMYPPQLKAAEKLFDYIYQPYNPDGFSEINSKVVSVKDGTRVVKYIPTPLDYIDGKENLSLMLEGVNNLKPDYLASFFYHPNIEFEFISLEEKADGYLDYIYSEQSPLHKMIELFNKKGNRFIKINDL